MNNDYTRCIVNADNEFIFSGMRFKISNKNKNYKVTNSYLENKEYTNSADMVYVDVTVKEKCEIVFLDELGKQIKDVFFVELVGV